MQKGCVGLVVQLRAWMPGAHKYLVVQVCAQDAAQVQQDQIWAFAADPPSECARRSLSLSAKAPIPPSALRQQAVLK